MFIDYVRVYQLPGTKDGMTCDPKAYPTAGYIQAHINAYSNPNLTTWEQVCPILTLLPPFFPLNLFVGWIYQTR